MEESTIWWLLAGGLVVAELLTGTFYLLMLAVGVANIARFVPQLTHRPRFVTQGERGAGFAEVARAVLATR